MPLTSSFHVSYPSLKDIVSRLKFEKREELARQVSTVRILHKTLPISLDSFHYSHGYGPHDIGIPELLGLVSARLVTTIKLDGATWLFELMDRSVSITMPSGNNVTLDGSHEVIQRFLDYYLGRPGTKIKEMTIKNYNEPTPLFFTNCPQVGSLKIEVTGVNHETGILGTLTQNQFKSIEIVDFCNVQDNSELLNELRGLETDELKYEMDGSLNSELSDVIARKMHVSETSIDADTFFIMCEKFKDEKFEIGSTYLGDVRHVYGNMFRVFDENDYWRMLKNELRCREMYFGGEECLTAPIENTDSELVIQVKRHLFPADDRCLLKAHVAEAGTTKSLGHLSPIDVSWAMFAASVWAPYRCLIFLLFEHDELFRSPRHLLIYNVCLCIGAVHAMCSEPMDNWLSVLWALGRRIGFWTLTVQLLALIEFLVTRTFDCLFPNVRIAQSRSLSTILYLYGLIANMIVNESSPAIFEKSAASSTHPLPECVLDAYNSYRQLAEQYNINLNVDVGRLADLYGVYLGRVFVFNMARAFGF